MLLPLLLCALLASQGHAARALHDVDASAACGAAGAPCGTALKAACNQAGLGFCQKGLFCGWDAADKASTCRPVPKGCGAGDGSPCCPGNAAAPIANASAATPKPVCASGSYCFFTPTPDASGWSAPAYASPAGALLGTCRAVAADCGTAEGKACCPSLYHTGVAPALPASITGMGGLCSGALFCRTTTTTDAAGRYWPQGVCVSHAPDCGKFGKSCCIQTSGVATSMLCGTPMGQPGPKGYCASPAGGASTADMHDMVCTPCPAASVVAANPGKYFGCS